jgi:hypothetical protein
MSENASGADWRKSTYSNGQGDCVEVATWRKASYSNAQGECVEVATSRKSTHGNGIGECAEVGAAWRKATHSNGQGQCVEVGKAMTAVLVRDTTNRSGPTLTIPASAWRTLLAKVRAC